MKNILITAFLATITLTHIQAEDVNAETCKTYIKEAKSFQSTMDTGKISQATLAFYKDKVVAHCGSIVAKVPYERNFFANALMKEEATTVNSCKLAIKMAKAYDVSANKSPFMIHAHEVNMIDNCGTLIAKKTPAFCLFDKVDNSKEDLKEKCVTSIKKAHAAIGTKAASTYKAEVVANCGRLQANL